ncbi:MAG: DegV family protein [Clostridia bacterium]|nr:DegV family protein [Clostridia bacterium]
MTERKFILSCGSTVDMPYSYCQSRDIPVVFYTYVVDGKEYVDDMLRDPEALPGFYRMLDAGALPHTSQVNTQTYIDFFDQLLEKGDVLHIAFGSGLSASAANALSAMEVAAAKHPDRTLKVVDSLAASSGQGLFVDMLADMRDSGATLEEAYQWAESNKLRINHQFFSTDLTHLRRNGRVSGPAAMLGTLLGICPIMHLNAEGRIIAYDKVRGKNNAVKETLRVMVERAENGTEYSGKCFISHSDSLETALKLREMILQTFPNLTDVRVYDIGTIIASHTGRGTVALFFYGKDRGEFQGES